MFRTLNRCYESLSDKSGITKEFVKFGGFDANSDEEDRLLSYAKFYAPEGSGRFEELNICNSHMPRLDGYRAMVKRWKASADKGLLTKDDIVRITTFG